jgi:hypothetical protein
MAHYLLTMAVLAGDTTYDARSSGVSAELVRERAVSCLRYLLRTHVTGDMKRPSGESWGDGAQAPWWVSRVAIAGKLLEPRLTPADREALQRVVTYEAGRQAARVPSAGQAGETNAVENAWSAELLTWSAALYPMEMEAKRWEERARAFLMNVLSMPQDREDEALADGRPVREQVATANLLADGIATTRGAVNFCALARPLPSLASIYYAYASTRRTPPQALLRHLDDVWRVAKQFYLFDGRFAYPAGQEWPRYTYGSYFMLPALALFQVSGGEPSAVRLMERALFRRFEQEQVGNADGTFYGSRFSGGATAGRGAMFETDTYAMLALTYLLHRLSPRIPSVAREPAFQEALAGQWVNREAEFAIARAPLAFCSISWRSVGERVAPRGLFVPAGGDDLVEWGPDQLIGSFEIDGFERTRTIRHHDRAVPGGIVSTGRILEGRREGAGRNGPGRATGPSDAVHPPVRATPSTGVHHHVAFVALPADGIVVLFNLSIAAQQIRVARNEGLQLYLANDLQNGNRRTLTSELDDMVVNGVEPGEPPDTRQIASSWVNVDGKLGVVLAYGQEAFTLRNVSARDQRPTDPFRSLLAEMLDTPFRFQPADYQPRQVVRDTITLLVAGDAAATKRAAERASIVATGQELTRAIWITGQTGQLLLLVANFGDREQPLILRSPKGEASVEVRVPPLDTVIVPAR